MGSFRTHEGKLDLSMYVSTTVRAITVRYRVRTSSVSGDQNLRRSWPMNGKPAAVAMAAAAAPRACKR